MNVNEQLQGLKIHHHTCTNELNGLLAELPKLERRLETMRTRIAQLRVDVPALAERIAKLTPVAEARAQQDAIQAQIAKLQKQLKKLGRA